VEHELSAAGGKANGVDLRVSGDKLRSSSLNSRLQVGKVHGTSRKNPGRVAAGDERGRGAA